MKPSTSRTCLGILVVLGLIGGPARADVTRDQVEKAIRRGVDFLKSQQKGDGSWPGQTGLTALAALALTTAGESPESAHIDRAYQALIRMDDGGHYETYTLGLKIMALSASPDRYRRAIEAYAARLEDGQIRSASRQTSGSWGYQETNGMGSGDNSNSQYALLGLNAASEAGVRVAPSVWLRARRYWEDAQ